MQDRLYSNRAKITKMRKNKTLKHERQTPEENEKIVLEEVREDNIDAAKQQKSKIMKKQEKNRA